MDDGLAAAFRATEYRVNTSPDTHACIRIGEPLPRELLRLLPVADAPWGYVTAWNPMGMEHTPDANETAQQRLLASLRQQVPDAMVLQGEGVGADGWREASLFVIDAPYRVLDTLMREFRQLAIVRGIGDSAAALRWNEELRESMDDADSHPSTKHG